MRCVEMGRAWWMKVWWERERRGGEVVYSV
jgi:hypothetical protein